MPQSCYRQIRKFAKRYFKNSKSGSIVYPDQTFIPNKLKFSYQYRKTILIKFSSECNDYIPFTKYVNLTNIPEKIIIHFAMGKARLCTEKHKKLKYLTLSNRSYVIPSQLIQEIPFLKTFKKDVLLQLEIPLRISPTNMLTTTPTYSPNTNKKAFIPIRGL